MGCEARQAAIKFNFPFFFPMLDFVEVRVPIRLHLPPIFSSRLQVGVLQYIHQLLLKYNAELQGIPVAINKISVLDPCAVIKYDNPYFHLSVMADLTLWRISTPNQLTCGEINKISGDHVGLIMLGTLNASIPASSLRSAYFYEIFSKKWIRLNVNDECIDGEMGNMTEDHILEAEKKIFRPKQLEIGQKLSFYVDGMTFISEDQISLTGKLTREF